MSKGIEIQNKTKTPCAIQQIASAWFGLEGQEFMTLGSCYFKHFH